MSAPRCSCSTTAPTRQRRRWPSGHGAQILDVPPPGGANAARNAGTRAARGDLIVLVDDDVDAPPGWLQAILDGADRNPDHDVFGGPIRARLEGGGPRSCGREEAPITTLDRGPIDRDVDLVWSANMAIRRSAFQRCRWLRRIPCGAGVRKRIGSGGTSPTRADGSRYLAAAGLGTPAYSGRTPSVTAVWLESCVSAKGRTSRRYDLRKGTSTLAGGRAPDARWLRLARVPAAVRQRHRARRPGGGAVVRGARETPGVTPSATADDFLSGTSGQVFGIRPTARAVLADAGCELVRLSRLEPWRLARAARSWPQRHVLALGIEARGRAQRAGGRACRAGALAPPRRVREHRSRGPGGSLRTSTGCWRSIRPPRTTGCC